MANKKKVQDDFQINPTKTLQLGDKVFKGTKQFSINATESVLHDE